MGNCCSNAGAGGENQELNIKRPEQINPDFESDAGQGNIAAKSSHNVHNQVTDEGGNNPHAPTLSVAKPISQIPQYSNQATFFT